MRKRKLMVFVASVLVGIGLGASIAYASIPGPDGVIHGCYKTSGPAQGALITVDSAATCPSGYTALNWNQTGLTGPTGPAGPTGPSGLGTIRVIRVDFGPITVTPGQYNQITGLCPVTPGSQEATVPIAANWYVNGNGDAGSFPDLTEHSSGPTENDHSWTITISNASSTNTYQVKEHVLCAVGIVGNF
jgi:hypothetical protein